MLTAGMKLALKIENVSNFQSDEARHEIAGILDATIAEAKHKQALADCKAVCAYCLDGTAPAKLDGREYYHGDESGVIRRCIATPIRNAYKAATGRELEDKT